MEDDDEFGDLYTDVLSAFPSSSTASHPPPPPAPAPVDIDLQSDAPATVPDSNFTVCNNDSKLEDVTGVACETLGSNSEAIAVRVLPSANLNLAPDVDGEDKQDAEFDNNFGVMDDLGSEPVIPGLATASHASDARPDIGGGEGDDWDSDSDDDLQIVLNDNTHGGHMGMEVASNDDDQDGGPLVIGADNDGGHQPAEEQVWGDDVSHAGDGKDISDAAKANGGLIIAPKIAYSNNGYHPFHSQFKYIRPGAAPLPGGPPVSSGGGLGEVRPSVYMGNMAGRGRGDWRPPGMKGPPMQKGFHPGFWGGNVQGRGLEFTLPSHKTVFEVDIDSFEEKTWKYPGVDVSDFFNFGLNEESWKEYCKQLEQLRLESTMQSKIRVYESGRAEQEYDPDLPPELAAAAGIYDTLAENADISKVQGEAGDPVRVRPPLPTGRAIQVETGCGERLPSVDTRPPRMRDSDAVIEIVLQDSMDDRQVGDGATECPANDSCGEDAKVDAVDEDGPQDEDEDFDGYSGGYSRMDEGVLRERSPIMNTVHDDMQDEDRVKLVPQRASSDHSEGHTLSKGVGSPNEERRTKGKMSQQSPHMSSGDSAQERSHDHHKEDSIDSMEGKHSVESEGTQMQSLEGRQVPELDVLSEGKDAKLNEDIDSVTSDSTSNDKLQTRSSKQEKLSPQVEPMGYKEVNDGGVFKARRSRDNSKDGRAKWHEGAEDEIVEDGRSTYPGDLKRSRGEGGRDSRRKDHDGRAKLERNHVLTKGREEYHSHRDWDPYDGDHFHLKGEGTDRRKERDYSDVNWQRREDEPHARRIRTVDTRKQERGDVTLLRDNFKVKEIDRNDKDEYLNSRKSSDNGSWRVYHEKDAGLRYRDKDDSSRSRHDVLDDRHLKKRKDDEYLRRDHVKKEEIMFGHGESSSTRRKRDRDDISSQWKKDDYPRVRDSMDDQNSSRHKDEVLMQREKDEWYRPKQSYEENFSRREKDDGRVSNRYNGHDKDTGRHGERRDRLENEIGMQYPGNEDVLVRGKQLGNEVKRSREEKPISRNDRGATVHTSVNQRVHEKHKDTGKGVRESEVHIIPGPSKRHRGEKGVVSETAELKGTSERSDARHDTSVSNSAKERRDASSDDEQNGSKKGRSKLERWSSHKDRDYDINSKSSSSLKVKEISRDKTVGSLSEDESIKVGASEGKDARAVDGHLDTFEKLKRRSERFKVPLTSEKDSTMTIKKTEDEALPPSSQNDATPNPLVKMDRPPRKRRWISS